MKIPWRTKLILIVSLFALYTTGLATWILSNWFLGNDGFGAAPSPSRFVWLQLHAIVGFWFLILFGYIFNSHVIPSWHKNRKIKTGLILTSTTGILAVTVPFLLYAASESFKTPAVWIHTYLGLAAVFIFLWHYFDRR